MNFNSARAGFSRSDLLPEQLADWLREEIVSGRMGPGERLVEQVLSKRCNVSRVPLREAMRIVAADGLLVLAPHRGAVVAPLSEDELRELFELRMALEGFAAALLAEKRPREGLNKVRAIAEEIKSTSRANAEDYGQYSAMAARFHSTIIEATGNQLFVETYDRIKIRFRRYQTALSKIPDLPSRSIIEHDEMLAAIELGDAKRARELSEQHIRGLILQYTGSGGPKF